MVRRGSLKLSLLVPEKAGNQHPRRASLDLPAAGNLPRSSVSTKCAVRTRAAFPPLERSLSSPVLGRDFHILRETLRNDNDLGPDAKARIERDLRTLRRQEDHQQLALGRRQSLDAIKETEDELGASENQGLFRFLDSDPCAWLTGLLKAVHASVKWPAPANSLCSSQSRIQRSSPRRMLTPAW